MPPGFMTASCACADAVYFSMPSAMTSPSGLSPAALAVLEMSAVMLPTTLLASGATALRYLSAMALAGLSTRSGLRRKFPAASFFQPPAPSLTPLSTIWLRAVAVANFRLFLSRLDDTSVSTVPNEPALLTTDVAPEELGSAQV